MINFEEVFASLTPEQAIAGLVSISLVDLDTTLATHPSLYSYAATVYELEKARETRAEVAVKRAKATVVRELVSAGTTATAAERLVELDQRVHAATETWLAHTARVAILRALVGGLDHRKDMLVNLAARTRRDR